MATLWWELPRAFTKRKPAAGEKGRALFDGNRSKRISPQHAGGESRFGFAAIRRQRRTGAKEGRSPVLVPAAANAGGLRNRVSRPPPTEAVVHTPSGLGRNRSFGFDRTSSGCHPATSSNCPPVLPAGKALSDSQIFWGDGTAKPYVDCLPLQQDEEGRLL